MAQVGLARKRRLRNLERGVVGGGSVLQLREGFFFDGEFAGIRKLEAVAGKNFNTVIKPAVGRRGNDDTCGKGSRPGEVGHARSGDDAGAVDIDADGGQTFGNAISNPGAGLARVLSDDCLRFLGGADQVMSESATDQIGALFGEGKFSRDTADAVGSEQLPLLAHRKL